MTVEIAPNGTHRITIDTPIVVREAEIADLAAMSEMWGPDRVDSQRRVLRRYFEDHGHGAQLGFVADFNGHLVGQLWSRYRHIDTRIADGLEIAYLHTLVVAPAFRQLGVAEGLTRAASVAAAQRGLEHLVIGVDRPNEYARRLYEKWGFRRYHETFDLRGDLVFLRRRVF